MPRGLPKAIIKKYGVTKKAWRVYRGKGNKRRKRKSSKGNPVARRRRSRRHNPNNRKKPAFTLPLAPTMGLVGGMWHSVWGWKKFGWTGALEWAKRGNYAEAAKDFTRINMMQFTGYDPEGLYPFGAFLGEGLLPLFTGLIVHKIASFLGVNRALGRAGVPVFRV